ncbi:MULTISPECIES: exodeoxyribonuclease VII small subunit [unclassified Cetobacterium]|uniref:exodeoxyribonuclease VII small subunit n=1 Tax=unclassified Cetobacterium TaxID=2630983 RepID=UPI00163B7F76|nr:exodeoxyribonuclease VII small subunit [Cetobacterium sp. 8H]MBC2851320.1 exodeoxyribonuclease VII small subunit [Cetobacterium sp. 8H]
MKKDSFEYNINEIDMIIEKLDSGELSLDESIKEYEKAMKLLKKSSDLLNKAEGKIIKVSSENENILLEVEEDA